MKIVCPSCDRSYDVAAETIGKGVRCANPQCRHRFVATPAEEAGAAPIVSGDAQRAELPVAQPASEDVAATPFSATPAQDDLPPEFPPALAGSHSSVRDRAVARKKRSGKELEQAVAWLTSSPTHLAIAGAVTVAVLLVAAIVAFVASSPSPRSVAQSFCENVAKGNIAEAKKYATAPTGQLLDLAAGFGALPIDPDFKFIFVEQTVDGNRAVVRFRGPENDDVESIHLVKIDGQWKVHAQKDAM